jgi:DnaJ-class molecular chaperone
MKVAACPWCKGKGFITETTPLTNIGATIEVVGKDCGRCEGSGVIAYKAIKEI